MTHSLKMSVGLYTAVHSWTIVSVMTSCDCRFVLGHPLVASAVIGATCVPQLDELIDAATQPRLPDNVLQEIEAVHASYPSPTP